MSFVEHASGAKKNNFLFVDVPGKTHSVPTRGKSLSSVLRPADRSVPNSWQSFRILLRYRHQVPFRGRLDQQIVSQAAARKRVLDAEPEFEGGNLRKLTLR